MDKTKIKLFVLNEKHQENIAFQHKNPIPSVKHRCDHESGITETQKNVVNEARQ